MPDKSEKEKEANAQQEARLTACDQSRECWAEITEAVTTEISKTTTEMMAKFMALLNECAAIPQLVSLQISSGTTRISTMPPFDWTMDKAIY